MFKTTILTLALAFGVVTAGAADVISFSDRASFSTNSGFATTIVPDGNISYSSSVAIGDLVFWANPTGQTPGNMVGVGEFSPLLAGADLALIEQNFAVEAANPVYGFGFDVVNASVDCGASVCVQSTFNVDVYSGAVLVASFQFTPGEGAPSFFGVAGDIPIDRFIITEIFASAGDKFFGSFVTTGPVAPVPLPASALFLIAGLAGLGTMKRRAKG